MWSSSTAHQPILKSLSIDPASFRLQQKDNYEYPTFEYPGIRHESTLGVPIPRIRTNCIIIKLYRPEGFTKSGIFVTPKKGPPIWAHLVAFHPNVRNYTHVDMTPGDMVLFKRYADDIIVRAGDLTLSIVHIKSVSALFTPPLVELNAQA